MKNTESRRYEMLLRVQEFGTKHRDAFPPTSPGGQAFDALSQHVTTLTNQALSKLSSARQAEGRRKQAARTTVVEQLDTIVRCARVIALETPGFGEAFQLGRLRSSQSLLTTGRLFLQEAPNYHEAFVANGMPDTFVTDLKTLLDAFEQTVKAWEAGRGGHAAARAGIESTMAAVTISLGKLDIFVANRFRDDPETLALWERARKLEAPRRPRRLQPEDATTAEPVATPVEPAKEVA